MRAIARFACVLAAAIVLRAQDAPQAAAPEPKGDRERAAALFAKDDFAGAAGELRKALDQAPDDARLAYNLALAQWRAGDGEGAETAAEKAAALSGGTLNPLRDGIVGNLRFDAARAKMAEDLQGARELAVQAQSHFARGAVAEDAPPALARNLERTLRLIAEIDAKIEEQKKQGQEKKDQEKKDQEKKDQEKKDDQKQDEKQDQQQKSDEQKQDEQKQDEQKQDQQQEQEPKPGDEQKQQQEPKPEKPGDEQKEPKPEPSQEQKPEQQEQQQPQQAVPHQLSEEETKRLMQKLEELEAQRIKIRAEQNRQRPRVERDW